MLAVTKELDVVDFNLSRKTKLFFQKNSGGLYLEAEKGTHEIEQSFISKLIENSQAYNDPDPYLEFHTDDILLEQAFNSLVEAKKFIRGTFARFNLSWHSSKIDILNKLSFFYNLFNLQAVNCRFEVLSTNSCKKFHCDMVKARLISTYGGPGTQVKIPDKAEVFDLPVCSTLIVKGTLFEDFKPVSLHRSPPIEESGTKRFVFIADFK